MPSRLIGIHCVTTPDAAPGLFVGAVHVAVCAPVVAVVLSLSAAVPAAVPVVVSVVPLEGAAIVTLPEALMFKNPEPLNVSGVCAPLVI